MRDYDSPIMQLHHTKAAFTAIWALFVIVASVFGNPGTASGWALLAVLAVIPPTVLWALWNTPAPSMSESIRSAKD